MGEGQGRVTLWGLEAFLAVAEEGTVTAAARRLGVSASAISQQVTALETTYATVLLDRSSRPMRLTPAGMMLRPHAQTILNAEAEARAALAMADLSALTTLRLGVIEDLDAAVTPRLLAGLAASLPNCRFLLETGASHRLLDALEARALDLVIAADPGGGPGEARVEVHPLLEDPFLAVLPQAGATCEGLPFIAYSARYPMGRLIAAEMSRANLNPARRFEMDSYNAILAMVAAGQGWTILTPLALHHGARFAPEVAVQPLPVAPFSRCIQLTARAGILQDIPAQVAGQARRLLAETVVLPAQTAWPWAGIRVLEGGV